MSGFKNKMSVARGLGCAAALAVIAVAAPASAVTIDVSQFARADNGPGFWTDTKTFVLPALATNIVLNITGFAADDRAVVQLNGVIVDSTGILGFGAPPSRFQFSAGGSNIEYTFITNGRPEQAFVPQNLDVTTGFLTGTNTLTFIVNDTGSGINGNTLELAGPTAYNFAGTVSYNLTSVPEPATWAMMLVGFGMLGVGLRNRKTARVTYA